MTAPGEVVLRVEDLRVTFGKSPDAVTIVNGVSFEIRQGETLGLVGESGCGKSMTCRSLIQLFGGTRPSSIEGSILFGGRNLAQLSPKDIVDIRGRDIAMIFQDPMTSLNPTMTIGRQIVEGLRRHEKLTHQQAHCQAIALLKSVGVTAPERRMDSYPHMFSGGMRQRVLIAIALSCRPRLLIADEPTTALDVTVQDQILKLILKLRAETGMAVLFVTHDLGVVAQTCDRVAVMYAGNVVETAETQQLFANPSHPYTRALLSALPAHGARLKRLQPIDGAPPNLADPPPGCRFEPRCRHAIPACAQSLPPLRPVVGSHLSACIRIGDVE
jgi:peptide/nickel transport system ATP-binding protein/oligopeptide transport system ATP-binding protein